MKIICAKVNVYSEFFGRKKVINNSEWYIVIG